LLFVFAATILPYWAPAAENDGDAYQSGLKAMQAGKTQEAIEHFSRAIAANPGDHRYYNDRGVAYKRAGNLEKAADDYSRSLEIHPGYTNALNNRGVVYLQQGHYDQAMADFTEALKQGGLEGTLYTNRGIARAAKGEHQAAIEDFNKAISFGSMDPRSFLFMGDSLEKTGSLDKALKMYQLALGLVKEVSVTDRVEQRIAGIERVMGLGKPLAGATPEAGRETGKLPSAVRDDTRNGQRTPQTSHRQIVRARPMHDADLTLRKEASDPVKEGLSGLTELNSRCQAKALSQFSPSSVEIYRQGVQFVEKSDWAKALVRFEDTRQLERRNKNPQAVAWCDLEIGRVYSKRGDYAKAGVYIEEALKSFNKTKSKECSLLALVALASNEKSAGHKDRAASLYSRSVEDAASNGWYSVARSISDLASGKEQRPGAAAVVQNASPGTATAAAVPSPPVKSTVRLPVIKESSHRIEKNTAVGHRVDKTQEKAAAQDSKASASLANVGRGPVVGTSAGTKARPTVQPNTASKQEPPTAQKPATVEAKIHPEREVLGARGTVSQGKPLQGQVKNVTEKTPHAKKAAGKEISPGERIRRDLAELKKLREAGEQQKMIPVLDRLSIVYAQNREYEKALHSIAASLAFREKLGFSDGADAAFEQSGTLKEKLGRSSEALEDYTRALAMASDKRTNAAKAKEAKISLLAQTLGINPSNASDAFKMLWEARLTETRTGETRALYLVGEIFDKAGRNEDALRYYERAAASMLMDKARVYNKMGQTGQAEKLYAQALETLKTVDHARYLEMQGRDQPPPRPPRQH